MSWGEEVFSFDNENELGETFPCRGADFSASGSYYDPVEASPTASVAPEDDSKSRYMDGFRHNVAGTQFAQAGLAGSLPVSIPIGHVPKHKGPARDGTDTRVSTTFIPPHQMSQVNAPSLGGSFPDMRLGGGSLLRQRNAILIKTGYLDGLPNEFAVSRVSMGTGEAPDTNGRIARQSAAHLDSNSALSAALAPVTEGSSTTYSRARPPAHHY